MLINKDNSVLMLIDVQERLLPGIFEHEKLVENCRWLVELAQLMQVPIIGTEQYPKGLGPTAGVLRDLLGADNFIGKTVFSCVDAPECQAALAEVDDKTTFVLCGMEAHACIVQTALQLREAGKEVYVVVDAVSARNPEDTRVALERMASEGVKLTTREMLGFDWVRRSDSEHFKSFSTRFLR